MIAATAGTLMRPAGPRAKRDDAWVKPALDLGAEGIVFPLVRTAEEAAECVALTRYPPHGRRGWGPFIAHARWGVGLFDYLPQRGDETVCMLLIETRAAVENIEAICRVEGIDGMVIGTFDLSTELGVSGRFDAPEMREAVAHLERAILRRESRSAASALTASRPGQCLSAATACPSTASTC